MSKTEEIIRRLSEAPKVITVCGSTKFNTALVREAKRLTLEGNIVLICPFCESLDSNEKALIERKQDLLRYLRRRRIDISDAIFVVNPDNYIGMSTISDIVYAAKAGKEVIYLEPGANPI